jgi:hypothetical protein
MFLMQVQYDYQILASSKIQPAIRMLMEEGGDQIGDARLTGCVSY